MKPTGVNFILFRSNGDIVLQKRDNKPEISWPDQWCFPGGSIEDGETAEYAAAREIKEETGIDVSASDCKFLFDHQFLDGDVNRFFSCRADNKNIISGEGKMEWKTIEEIKKIKLADNQNDIINLLDNLIE